MLRSTQPLLRALPKAPRAPAALGPRRASIASLASPRSRAAPAPLSSFSPVSSGLVVRSRYATIPPVSVDKEREKEVAKKKIEARPEEVSTSSSVRHLFEGSPGQDVKREDEDVAGSLKQDVEAIKDTFALKTVPPISYTLGIAGTLPYVATSIATVYLGWDLNTDFPSQSAFLGHIMVSHETADHWLKLLEPIQLGYGAVILSFLGAIHWGLEFAEKSPLRDRTRFRYGLGVLAPAVAWPTLFMPVQFALISQFAAFIALYFADTRATYRGWAPAWYGTYRFVLTFLTGGAILISLIGREKIGADKPQLQNLREKMHKTKGSDSEQYVNWEKLENEERERIKKEAEAERKRKEAEKKSAGKKKKGDKGGEARKNAGEKNEDDDEDDEQKGEDEENDGGEKEDDDKEGSEDKKQDGEQKDSGKKGSEQEDKEGKKK